MLFLALLPSLPVLLSVTGVVAHSAPATRPKPEVSSEILAAVECELERLDKQAQQEPVRSFALKSLLATTTAPDHKAPERHS